MGQVEDRVAHQHFVVEAPVVVTDHQIGPPEQINQLAHPVFAEDFVTPVRRAVGDADGYPHVGLLVPSTDIVGGALGLQIKVDDVLGLRHGLVTLTHSGVLGKIRAFKEGLDWRKIAVFLRKNDDFSCS